MITAFVVGLVGGAAIVLLLLRFFPGAFIKVSPLLQEKIVEITDQFLDTLEDRAKQEAMEILNKLQEFLKQR